MSYFSKILPNSWTNLIRSVAYWIIFSLEARYCQK
jgi:hypothetical protein